MFARWWLEQTGEAIYEIGRPDVPVAFADRGYSEPSGGPVSHPMVEKFQAAAVTASRTRGACHLCDRPISRGEEIVKLGRRGSWVHLKCVEREVVASP